MRNITVSVDDETYRQARIRAAEMDTSVSALVREYLRALSYSRAEAQNQETASQRRMRKLHEAREQLRRNGTKFRVADNVPRDQLYDRHAPD